MKKDYIKPIIEIENIVLEDIMSVSLNYQENGNGDVFGWDEITWG